MNKYFAFTILTLFSSGACFTKRAKELTAIIMFACVVGISLLITFKAAKKQYRKKIFIQRVMLFQLSKMVWRLRETICLPPALLGISSMVFFKGYDGFIYVTGFLFVGPF